MPEPELRRLTLQDLDSLLSLYAHLFASDSEAPRNKLEQAWLRILANDDILHLGVFIDGALISAAHAVVVPNLTHGARPYALIEAVVTHERYRRQGLGKRTLQALIEHCWQADCYKVMLASGTQRASAHEFYRSLGFDGDAKRAFVLRNE